MEGQKLGNRSILREKHGPWLSHSVTQALTESLTYPFSAENLGIRAVGCQFMFQTLLQIVRMAHPSNLLQPPRLGNAISRMQGAEGCAVLDCKDSIVGVNFPSGYVAFQTALSKNS